MNHLLKANASFPEMKEDIDKVNATVEMMLGDSWKQSSSHLLETFSACVEAYSNKLAPIFPLLYSSIISFLYDDSCEKDLQNSSKSACSLASPLADLFFKSMDVDSANNDTVSEDTASEDSASITICSSPASFPNSEKAETRKKDTETDESLAVKFSSRSRRCKQKAAAKKKYSKSHTHAEPMRGRFYSYTEYVVAWKKWRLLRDQNNVSVRAYRQRHLLKEKNRNIRRRYLRSPREMSSP